MEIEFEEEGGYADVSTGLNAETTLSIFSEGGSVRIEIDSRTGHGEIGLGVGLDAKEAQRVADYIRGLAADLDADEE